MPHTPLPFYTPDLSAFTRSLGQAWQLRQASGVAPPGHVELLNLIARAAGHRNVQSLRAASRPPRLAPAAEDAPTPPQLSDTARKTLAQFDSRGRLVRWPSKYSVQKLAMWVLWTHFDGRRVYAESEVNTILKAAQTFGDHVTLRRELINHRLMSRESDCSAYRKLPARPDDEARALLTAWRARVREPLPSQPIAAGGARKASASAARSAQQRPGSTDPGA